MTQDTQIVLPFARLCGKNLQADFEGGTLSSDGGVLFLREIETQVGMIRRFDGALDDPRHARYTDHRYEELLRQRIFQIACGYEDANDCNTLRRDPAFKSACGRLPLCDDPLASQPGMSRFENVPRRTELYRTAQALFDTFVASYRRMSGIRVYPKHGINKNAGPTPLTADWTARSTMPVLKAPPWFRLLITRRKTGTASSVST